MKITCDIIQDLLPLYCDRVCSEDSKQAIEAHLQECEQCREDLLRMQEDIKGVALQANECQIVEAAETAWKKGKKRAFIKGCLIVLLGLAMLVGTYTAFHWFSTADENDHTALARQAAEYFDRDELFVEKIEKRGNYLAALCKDKDGNWCMCVFDRDSLFDNRWIAGGGKPSLKTGTIGSWNYGSPEGEAVLIFCGGSIPDEVCWYKFQNGYITYTCPVDNNTVLDIFVIPDRYDINGHPIPLDNNQQEID